MQQKSSGMISPKIINRIGIPRNFLYDLGKSSIEQNIDIWLMIVLSIFIIKDMKYRISIYGKNIDIHVKIVGINVDIFP